MDSESAENIIEAIQNRNLELVKALLTAQISRGYSVNQPLPDLPNSKKLDWTPLFWSVVSGDEAILAYLLGDLKANPNIVDADRQNPAHLTVRVQERSYMLRTLTIYGCDVTARDGNQMNIVDIASMSFGIGTTSTPAKIQAAAEALIRCRYYQKFFLLFVRSRGTDFLKRIPIPLLRDVFDFLLTK